MYRILFDKIILMFIVLVFFSCSSAMKSKQGDTADQEIPGQKADYSSKEDKSTSKDYDTGQGSSGSTNEYIAKHQEIFDKLDQKGGEDVDVEEFIIYWCNDTKLKKGVRDPEIEPIYREMDINNDGTVTYQECNAYWVKRLNEFDLSKKGKITKKEYNTLIRERNKRLMQGSDQEGHITNEQYDYISPPMRP
jgi:Ca2+-binding EF-hand superfamily protein